METNEMAGKTGMSADLAWTKPINTKCAALIKDALQESVRKGPDMDFVRVLNIRLLLEWRNFQTNAAVQRGETYIRNLFGQIESAVYHRSIKMVINDAGITL